MSAGLSQKQIYNRIYKRLKKIQWEAHQQNINLIYRNRTLYDDENHPVIYFEIHQASNGEICGILKNYSIFKTR